MDKAGRILEFEKIRGQLRNFTLTVPGDQMAADLKPSTNLEKVIALQGETSEAAGIILQKNLSFQGCGDLMPYLKRAERGGILNQTELKAIEIFLRSLERVKTYFFRENEMKERFPRLHKFVMEFKIFPDLTSQLEKCLDSKGEIRDNASPRLSSLRSEEKRLQEKIRRSLESFLKAPQYQKYLQENIVTVRHDRYVLPIKQEYRNRFPGVVHDQSASGVTLFIEPLPVLELNNRLRGIKGSIEDEIEKILQKLTQLVSINSEAVISAYEAYGMLDFVLARGHLSISHRAREPLFNKRGYLSIIKGRHPLLPVRSAVPVDVHLGGDFNTLVITGPNTGGKTVTLKTIGLFALMAQCGLHIPADAGTDLGIFEGVWCDIGDEQNIEQSLSTFSGHMMNIIEILQKSGSSSLVLLDELGSGTDPSEGSALAMAILDELHSRGARTVATTHINELKVFAHLNEGMENASMEFDPLTLSPTFRLLIGVPGQSNALTVAGMLGMSSEIIDKARSYISKEFLDLEEVVSGLVEERRKLSQDSGKIEAIKMEMATLLREIEEEKESLKQKRREILKKARDEAGEIVRTIEKKTGEILKALHRIEREKSGREALALGEESRKEMKTLKEELRAHEIREEMQRKPLKRDEIREGQAVYVKSLRCPGEIIRINSDEEIQVQAGVFRINTGLYDLEVYNKKDELKEKQLKKKEEVAKSRALMWEKSGSVSHKLDLRGLNLEEAIIKVEKHLDDAILAGLDRIDLIHGKGTGRLRSGLQEYLQGRNHLQSYRLGDQGEGGSGVTIVYLKKTGE
ncbi:MAG: endonuclease MutS2 [Bacillota bacterium]|nr:endonuclease MutS2 [Bacillota bacterium]